MAHSLYLKKKTGIRKVDVPKPNPNIEKLPFIRPSKNTFKFRMDKECYYHWY